MDFYAFLDEDDDDDDDDDDCNKDKSKIKPTHQDKPVQIPQKKKYFNILNIFK